MYKNAGFTLIELLVVVLIIGILSAVALPQYQKAVLKSRMTELQTVGEAIARAEEVYYLANGSYTRDLTALDIEVPTNSNFVISPDIGSSHPTTMAINVISSKWGLGYVPWLQYSSGAGRRECRVYRDEALLHQVCKSLAPGATAGNCGRSSFCRAYIL